MDDLNFALRQLMKNPRLKGCPARATTNPEHPSNTPNTARQGGGDGESR